MKPDPETDKTASGPGVILPLAMDALDGVHARLAFLAQVAGEGFEVAGESAYGLYLILDDIGDRIAAVTGAIRTLV